MNARTLFAQLGAKDPKFSNYLGLVKKFVEDPNVMALEKGLDALLLFVENAAVSPKYVNRSRPQPRRGGVGPPSR